MTPELEQYLRSPQGRAVVREGANAHRDGNRRDDNPYPQSYRLRYGAWEHGWDSILAPLSSMTFTIPDTSDADRWATIKIKTEQSYFEEPETMTQLYEVDGKYVHRLATNSLGQAVVEERGTGAVFAVDPTKLAEVVPYTIDVTFNGGTQSFIAKPDQVQEGDMLLSLRTGTFGVVGKLDTKNKHTKAELAEQNFRRVKTEALS